jgi:hypothetical protein
MFRDLRRGQIQCGLIPKGLKVFKIELYQHPNHLFTQLYTTKPKSQRINEIFSHLYALLVTMSQPAMVLSAWQQVFLNPQKIQNKIFFWRAEKKRLHICPEIRYTVHIKRNARQ